MITNFRYLFSISFFFKNFLHLTKYRLRESIILKFGLYFVGH